MTVCARRRFWFSTRHSALSEAGCPPVLTGRRNPAGRDRDRALPNARHWGSAIAEGEELQLSWPGSDGGGLSGIEVLPQRQFGVVENARTHAGDRGHESAHLDWKSTRLHSR